MGNSRIDATALFLAFVAGVLLMLALRGSDNPLASIGGLILLFVLFAYDREGQRTGFQSLAFGSVCGFALMLISSVFFQLAFFGFRLGIGFTSAVGPPPHIEGFLSKPQLYTEYLPITWACATFVFTLIDRFRMASRAAAGRPAVLGIPPEPRREVAPPLAAAPHVRPAPPPEPQPVATPASASEPETPAPTPAAAASAVPERAVPVAKGKESDIYVNLVGEGLSLMRTVRAQHMGKDFYLITEPMPKGEQWEFTTGQIVRCKKKNLSHGKGLVAVEEAPRAS